MRAAAWNERLFAAHRSYIKAEDVHRAFDFLTAAAFRSDQFSVKSEGGGRRKKSFQYDEILTKQRPFGFVVNQGHLLFYVRRAGLARFPEGIKQFRNSFATVKENSNGEWTIRIETLEEAQRLQDLVFESGPPESLPDAAESTVRSDAKFQNDENLDDTAEEAIRRRIDIEASEKDQLIRARRGQGRFRHDLENLESGCRLTGLIDRRHLRARHIKPWRDSDDKEKLDPNNGLLLSPHIDHLFDRGYISFADSGEVLLSKSLNPAVLDAWKLQLPATVLVFNAEQRVYLEYHRRHIFEVSFRRDKAAGSREYRSGS